jgi:hypothetical protein
MFVLSNSDGHAWTTALFVRLSSDGQPSGSILLGFERAELVSESNENTTYHLTLFRERGFPEERLALVIGTSALPVSGWGRGTGGSSISVRSVDALVVPELERNLGASVFSRRNPGHGLTAWFVADKVQFYPGERVTATLHIRNTGSAAICFRDGGKQRGRRNNQFAFLAERNGANVPDVGSSLHFGGLSRRVMLRPGEEFERKADLSDWFAFSEVGDYLVHGSFALELFEGPRARHCIWTDSVSADVRVLIR